MSNELSSNSVFSVSATSDNKDPQYVVDHFLLDQHGNPIVDPVAGGSQFKTDIQLPDGTIVQGAEANPNNWLIAPLNYTLDDAITYANVKLLPTTDLKQDPNTYASSFIENLKDVLSSMFMDFQSGGSQDLQRNKNWGIPDGYFVSAFTDVASFHLGLVTTLSELPIDMAEIPRGALNFIHSLKPGSTIDTSGVYDLSMRNELNINAGYELGNQILQGGTGIQNLTKDIIMDGDLYTVDISGDQSTNSILGTKSGIEIIASRGNDNLKVNAGENIVINGYKNWIKGDDTIDITLNGSYNLVSVGDGVTVNVTGVGNIVSAGVDSTVNVYGNSQNPTQLTESTINSTNGTSQHTTYSNILGQSTSTTDTYDQLNDLGFITEHQVNNFDGTSTDTSYQLPVSRPYTFKHKLLQWYERYWYAN